jgi:uncharacterized protein (DUF1778 family)
MNKKERRTARVELRMRKAQKEALQAAAKRAGVSITRYIEMIFEQAA